LSVVTRVIDFTWKVGGQQGEGIDSTGEIFAQAMHRRGFYVYAYRHFMSRIKGGHTHYKIRVRSGPVWHRGDQDDLLVAFDQESIDYNLPQLRDGTAIVHDAAFVARVPEGRELELMPVPMTRLAEEQGRSIMKNMVAVGVSAAMLGLELADFETTIRDRFGDKGEQVVEANRKAFMAGYDYYKTHFTPRQVLADVVTDRPESAYLSGNDAIALGALVAGCRLLFAYPITPATEILYTAFKYFPRYGGAIVQGEDEMAAAFMAIGAGFAGVRAMTSTSGPGLSLMMESLGLAGIAEVPLVIVDVQRAGPSTGLPTKTEQGDLNTIVYGSHGESPRIVLAPSTVADCFHVMGRAFNLAEHYQCPVIVVSDLALGLSRQSVPVADLATGTWTWDRGLRVTDDELKDVTPGTFARYRLTESGISPRTVPGQPNGRFTSLSNEHSEISVEEESPENRVRQMHKRMKKLHGLDLSDWALEHHGPERADLLLVGYGSSYGPIAEVWRKLADEGARVGRLHLKALWPLPEAGLARYLEASRHVLVVESNYSGQVANLIKLRLGFKDRIRSCLKFDGNPFTANEIYRMAKEVV